MEQNLTSNRIHISPFGYDYIQKLPEDLEQQQEMDHSEQENILTNQSNNYFKGNTLNFHKFASQTQQLLFRHTNPLFKTRKVNTVNNQSKRKLQLHHENWQSEQKLISHKLMDIQSKQNHQKYSQYDWKSVNSMLKTSSYSIIDKVDQNVQNRKIRTRNKLQRLLIKKYPNRSVNQQL